MNNEILVSVLVSTYNSEKFFKEKIEDLLAQTIADKIEIIIINSGSQQNEEKIYQKEFSAVDSIKYIKTEERETIYKAWNRGIKIAKGKYITNSNTDDRLRNDALEVLSNELEKNPDAALVYGNQYYSYIPNEKFSELKKKKLKANMHYSKLKLLDRYILGSHPMWRASLHFKDNIWFDDNYEVAGDYDFALKISQKYNMSKINAVLGIYYRSKTNENKEFQNLSITVSESEKIRRIYVENYIRNISEKEMIYINRLYFFSKIFPSKIYSILKKIIAKILPDQEPYEKNFIIYLKKNIGKNLSFAKKNRNYNIKSR